MLCQVDIEYPIYFSLYILLVLNLEQIFHGQDQFN